MFPQITRSGLEDSWQHGRDIFEVYHDFLRFLPDVLDSRKVEFRVTNNVITSEVAGMVIAGMYGEQSDVPLHVQVCFSRISYNGVVEEPAGINKICREQALIL